MLIEADVQPHDLGPMTIPCPFCHAMHWMAERRSDSSNRNPRFGDCCKRGKIGLPKLEPVPQTLRDLLEGQDHEARQFRQNIRQYNAALAFTSNGGDFGQALQGGGPYVLQLHGELYHQHGSLIPDIGQKPQYAALYIYDPDFALDQRKRNNPNVSQHVMSELQEMLHQCNPYVTMYRQAAQRLREQGQNLREQGLNSTIRARLTYRAHNDPRRYNIPEADEIAVVLPGEGITHASRDTVVQLQGGAFQRVFDTHPSYAPLHYVLLFPQGELGWHPEILYYDE